MPVRKLSAMNVLAWCFSIMCFLFMGGAIVGYGTSPSTTSVSPNPTTLLSVTVEGGDPSEVVALKIPLLISERTLPTDSTITYSIAVDVQDVESIRHPAVLLERPLHMASVTWDGIDVPLFSSHGGDRLDGEGTLLGRLPVISESAVDSHLLTVTLTGAHGYLGVANAVSVGEFAELERWQQFREFRLEFGATVLSVTGVVLLLIGLFSKTRGEFVAAGLFSLLMGLTICTFADVWSVMPGGLEYRLRIRHAAIGLSPFFGITALMFIVQERQGQFVLFVGVASFAIATVAMGWPDSTILPYVRLLEQLTAVATLIYGIAKSFKHSLQGVFEARIVLAVVLALMGVWLLSQVRYGMVGDGSLLVLVFVAVCVSMMILLIRRYLTSSERYAQFVSEAFDAIIVVDSSGIVVESNASGRLLLGGWLEWQEGTICLFEKIEPLDIELCRKHVANRSGEIAELRFPIRRGAGGPERTVHVDSVSVALENNLALLVLRDVTQRRQIEGRIISSVRMETLGIVARGIAHDYNNTLSAVLGQLTMLEHEVEAVDSDLVHRIERLIVETSERTRRQLAIVRGGNEPSRSVDPIDLVESISQLVTGTLPDNVFLKQSFGEDLPSVHCKAVEIEQVLLSLVTNARDALADQGRGQIEIRAEKAAGDFVVFSVTDDGPVIPKEHAYMVWSPFFSSAGRDLGAGLAMSVVQRVVREHGGSVSFVTPMSGVGARFEVFIPTSEATAHSEPTVASTKLGHVLVVEDEPNIREVMVSILRLRGFTVAQAESSEIARENYNPKDFQLLVTDVIMGSENGISLAKNFTKINPRLAVLVVSGRVPEKLSASDTWAFLDKPFTPDMLVASARKAILLSKVTPGEPVYE